MAGRMHSPGILMEECRAVASLLAIIAVAAAAADGGEGDMEVLLAGVGVGMAFINTLLHLRPMALLPRVALMFMFLASLLSPQLQLFISNSRSVAAGHQHTQMAAVLVAYCRWALPHVLIAILRTLITMMMLPSTPTTPTPTPLTPARASFQALALLALDIVFVFALGLGLGVKGVAMASWCSDVAHGLFNAAVTRLPTPPTTTTSHDDEEEDKEDVERWRYNSLVVIAWLLLLPSSPVSSVAAAVSMMRIASFLQTLSVALARCYSHLNVFAVCALGLAQGLLILGVQIALQESLHYVAAHPHHVMLAMIREAGPAWSVWAVATGIRSSACKYICHCRGHHGGTAAIAPVKLLCTCVVGIPVSVLASFLLDQKVVAGLCYGVAAVQISQAVALMLLMLREPPAAESQEAGSSNVAADVSTDVSIWISSDVSISIDAPLSEDYQYDSTSCPPSSSSQGCPEEIC